MTRSRSVLIADLLEGHVLAQDVMVGSQVLLRSGTVLRATQIARIKKLNFHFVVVTNGLSLEPHVTPQEVAAKQAIPVSPLPNFSDFSSEEAVSWMAGEDFHAPVEQSSSLLEIEVLFSKIKDLVRKKAGLSPMLEPKVEARLAKEVHATYVSSAIKKVVNLEQVAGTAEAFSKELAKNPDGYIDFTDIEKYGQHLSSRSVLSCKIAHGLLQDPDLDLAEQFRGQLALNFAHALLPQGMLEPPNLLDPAQKKIASDALLRYYSWLRSQKFLGERILEMILLQHEMFDGSGIPYGLSSDAIPAVSETWAMCGSYAGNMFSKPKSPRINPREAADNLVGNAGKAFSSKGVNRFLSKHGYYPSGSLVELNDERKALVVGQNTLALLKPNIRPLDQTGNIGALIELHKETNLYILRQIMEY